MNRFTPYRLSVLTNVISFSIAQTYAREFGLTIPEWRVMAVLARYPELPATAVAERTAMDKVAVSRAVASLLAAKRLMRTSDADDKRRALLRLSTAGEAIYRRVAPLALAYEHALLAALDAQEQRTLDVLLDKLTSRAHALADA